MDITELFRSLESNQAQAVEDVKIKFHEYLNATKESWVMNGLFDYYLSTGSLRVVEILVGVREPHERYLFDRLSETLRGTSKLQGLTLLGHIVRRNPTWLYKITQHNLIKELLKLLKFETDMLSVMSALLVIIVLLPMIAGFVAPLLQEIFEVFSRLASWNTNNPNKMSEGYLLHLQVGLYALFHRLYGMFPCNFLAYLRQEYSFRGDNHAIFSHTIKPMLETVKMHPLLVTASKDAETSTGRWKKMEPHDVIVECAKFTVETTSNSVTATDNKPKDDSSSSHQHHSSSHCSRSSLECSGVLDGSYTSRGVRAHSSQLQSSNEKEIWTPNTYCGGATSPPDLSASAPTSIPHTPISQTFAVSSSFPQQEGTSPPEAAVEATPETTPVKDLRQVSRGPPSVGSSVVRALNSTLGPAGGSSPMHSQPSSPMKKEASPFRFPPDNCSAFQQLPRTVSTTANSIQSDHNQARRDSVLSQRVQRIVLERIQITEAQMQDVKTTLKPRTPVSNSSASIIQPTSPLRVIPGAMLDRDIHQAPNSPLLMTEETQEDKEVETMMRGGSNLPMTVFTASSAGRQCDSVLQEFHQHQHHDEEHVEVEGYEECQQESGSPCTSGGLHMPNSQSMRDFARQVNRLRYYSYNQGNEGNERHIVLPSTGSSLSEGSSFPTDSNFRRAFSCPEMKKSTSVSTLSVGDQLPLDENEEEEEEIGGSVCVDSNGSQSNESSPTVNGHTSLSAQESMTVFHKSRKRLISSSTQTENALPYEHLFLNVFPYIEQHHTPPPDTGTPSLFPNKTIRFSPYQAVETFINTTVQCYDNKRIIQGIENELKLCKDQLVLLNLQLQFERHRREVHAERNRRLLGKSRNNRALEEYNSALRDQVTLLQHDKDSIREELKNHQRDSNWKLQKLEESVDYWQDQSKKLQKACDDAKACCETLQQELKQEREKTATVTKKWNDTKAQLFDTCSELQQALNMLSAGREVREELQTLQREVVMGGELQVRCRDTLAHLARAVHHSAEFSLHHETYIRQFEALKEKLEVKKAGYDGLQSKIAELQSIVSEKDKLLSEQNRLLDKAQTDHNEQLQIAERKHQALSSTHAQLEEQIVSLYDQIETLSRQKQPHQKQHSTVSSPMHKAATLLAQSSNVKKLPSLSHLSGSDVQMPMRNIHGLVEDSELQTSSVSAVSPSSSDTFH